MIKVKDNSVLLSGLQPEMNPVLEVVEKHLSHGLHLFSTDVVITAGTEEFNPDGTLIHMVGSYHPRGYALDFRDCGIPTKKYGIVLKHIRADLHQISLAYDVVREGDHIHIEYDLKKAFLLAR